MILISFMFFVGSCLYFDKALQAYKNNEDFETSIFSVIGFVCYVFSCLFYY